MLHHDLKYFGKNAGLPEHLQILTNQLTHGQSVHGYNVCFIKIDTY